MLLPVTCFRVCESSGAYASQTRREVCFPGGGGGSCRWVVSVVCVVGVMVCGDRLVYGSMLGRFL